MTFLLKIIKICRDTNSFFKLFEVVRNLFCTFEAIFRSLCRIICFETVFEGKTAHAEPRSLSLVSIAKAGNGWEHGKGHRKAFTKRSVHGHIEHLANRR
jgi:hypothetical protein